MEGLPYELLSSILVSLKPQIETLRLQLSTAPLDPVQQFYIHAPFSPAITSLVLRSIFSDVGRGTPWPSAAFVDCNTGHQPRVIYDAVLNELAAWKPVWNQNVGGVSNWDGRTLGFEIDEQGRVSWDEAQESPDERAGFFGHTNDSLGSFIEGLKRTYELHPDQPVAKFIIFTNAHLLLHLSHSTAAATSSEALESNTSDGSFLAALSRLGELTGKPIVPVFVSELPPHQYQPAMGRALEPFQSTILFLPQVNSTDIVNLFSHFYLPTPEAEEAGVDRELHADFVRILYETFSSRLVTLDVVEELYRLSTGPLWDRFMLLVAKHNNKNIGRLTTLLKPALQVEMEQLGQLAPFVAEGLPPPSTGLLQGQLLGLRTTAAFLLFSALLASYNPARTDVKMFAVGAEEGKNRKRRSPKKASPRKKAESQRLTGPKAFPIERLMAIFSCILPEEKQELAESDRALSEVADLVASRLLVRVSKGSDDTSLEHLTGIKLKVNVEQSVVEALAKQYRFPLREYIWDME